jgi:tRNA pseudouridine(38-40) synthase
MSGCGPQLRKRIARPLSRIRPGPVCALRSFSRLHPREMEQERSTLSQTQLVERVTSLEAQLKELTQKYLKNEFNYSRTSDAKCRRYKILQKSTVLTEFPEPAKEYQLRPKRNFDPSRYSTRFIALKFAYLGQRYNGFEHHVNNITPLPTIEEVLWRALTKAKLLVHTGTPPEDPDQVNWEGCEYSKCGRTDRGVSAFGQVVGLRVRSSQPLQQCNGDVDKVASEDVHHFDPIRDELPYVQILNRLLPSDIRVLAWCPNPPKDFSARFSCRERRYRYFFTQPAFAPTPGAWGLSLGLTNQANAKRR